MERKTFEYKASVDAAGSIEGHGAVTGNRDSYDDVIAPGAYVNLDEFVAKGSLLVGHDWGGFGIGTIDAAREDEVGLYFKATFHTDEAAQQIRDRVMERMDRGKFVGLSIGYETLDAAYETRDGVDVRVLKAIKIYEISLVTVPANPLAGVVSAKSFEDEGESALASVRAYLQRARALKALRESDGRTLSDVNQTRLGALAADLEGISIDLRELILPEPKAAPDDHLAHARHRFAQMMAGSAGIR